MDRLSKVAWQSGKTLPDHLNENLSQTERFFYKNYLQALDQLS